MSLGRGGEDGAAGRLSLWRGAIASGLARITALLFFLPCVWVAIDSARYHSPRAVWTISLFEASSAACALLPLSPALRARALLCSQLFGLWMLAPMSGPTAAIGALLLMLAIEAALLLDGWEASLALLAAILGLWRGPLWMILFAGEAPIAGLSDMRNPANAMRTLFAASAVAILGLVAITYLTRKIIRMLFESEALIDSLRSEMTAREAAELRRKQAEAELVRAHKLETLGLLAGSVAHDINNNLTLSIGAVDVIERRFGTEDGAQEMCDLIRQSVESATGLTRQLLTLGRRDLPRRTEVSLADVFHRIERLIGTTLGDAIDLTVVAPERIPNLFVDASQLEQALLNLAINARDAMPQGGALTFRVEHGGTFANCRVATSGEEVPDVVRILVSDTGKGIQDDILPNVLEPFFTTKGPEKGSGLGLSVVCAFVESNGGRLCIDTQIGRGTTVALELPAHTATKPLVVPADGRAAPGTTVLVVDDDARVRARMASELRSNGYLVIEAGDGVEALEQARAAERIDLLCTDVRMPRLGGMELLRIFARLHRQAGVLVCSAYVHEPELRDQLAQGAYASLPKPFSSAQLIRAIAHALPQCASH